MPSSFLPPPPTYEEVMRGTGSACPFYSSPPDQRSAQNPGRSRDKNINKQPFKMNVGPPDLNFKKKDKTASLNYSEDNECLITVQNPSRNSLHLELDPHQLIGSGQSSRSNHHRQRPLRSIFENHPFGFENTNRSPRILLPVSPTHKEGNKLIDHREETKVSVVFGDDDLGLSSIMVDGSDRQRHVHLSSSRETFKASAETDSVPQLREHVSPHSNKAFVSKTNERDCGGCGEAHCNLEEKTSESDCRSKSLLLNSQCISQNPHLKQEFVSLKALLWLNKAIFGFEEHIESDGCICCRPMWTINDSYTLMFLSAGKNEDYYHKLCGIVSDRLRKYPLVRIGKLNEGESLTGYVIVVREKGGSYIRALCTSTKYGSGIEPDTIFYVALDKPSWGQTFIHDCFESPDEPLTSFDDIFVAQISDPALCYELNLQIDGFMAGNYEFFAEHRFRLIGSNYFPVHNSTIGNIGSVSIPIMERQVTKPLAESLGSPADSYAKAGPMMESNGMENASENFDACDLRRLAVSLIQSCILSESDPVVLPDGVVQNSIHAPSEANSSFHKIPSEADDESKNVLPHDYFVEPDNEDSEADLNTNPELESDVGCVVEGSGFNVEKSSITDLSYCKEGLHQDQEESNGCGRGRPHFDENNQEICSNYRSSNFYRQASGGSNSVDVEIQCDFFATIPSMSSENIKKMNSDATTFTDPPRFYHQLAMFWDHGKIKYLEQEPTELYNLLKWFYDEATNILQSPDLRDEEIVELIEVREEVVPYLQDVIKKLGKCS